MAVKAVTPFRATLARYKRICATAEWRLRNEPIVSWLSTVPTSCPVNSAQLLHPQLRPQPIAPGPQSQSLSRGYGSMLPTSLTYILPSTRGCSPWRPDAVIGTTRSANKALPQIFTGPHARSERPAFAGRYTPSLAAPSPDNPLPGQLSSSLSAVNENRQLSSGRMPALALWVRSWRCRTCIHFLAAESLPPSLSGILTSCFFTTTAVAAPFGSPLGSAHPCTTAVHMEPFSTSVFKRSHLNSCYYHQDLH